VPAPLRIALPAWGLAWALGGVLGILALAVMGVDFEADRTISELTVAAVVSWAVFMVALYVVSVRCGTADIVADYRLAFRPIDLVALPAGAATQLVVIPAVYWPLQQLWPESFSDERLEERAIELVDRADGASVALLVAVVVIGAPLFEELVYRGLLQRSVGAAIGRWWGLLVTAAWFAVIHLTPVEYPGLFVAGLVFGLGLALTDRLGPAILAHVGFNATGLALAFNAS
jgi:membrane protease YdiL (CAAX protease family)